MLKIFYFLLIERFLSYRVAFRTTTARDIATGGRQHLPVTLECAENIPYLRPFVQRFTIGNGRLLLDFVRVNRAFVFFITIRQRRQRADQLRCG